MTKKINEEFIYFKQADYALKYKTGISAPRPTKKFSEYQKQFQWKAGIPPSPLLTAEQVTSHNFKIFKIVTY